MKIPIPKDWDGTTWKCVQIQWPDSLEYRGLLVGFVDYLTRGRVYDEETGSIKDAQQIGLEIFTRNYPWRDCAGAPVPTPGIGEVPCFGGYEDYEGDCGKCRTGEEEMTNAPCPPIKIEGGVLYWWNCCQWQAVGSLSPQENTEPLPDNFWETEENPTPTYYPCGRAKALVDAIYTVAQGIWEAGDSANPFAWPGEVENYAGIGDLKDKYIYEGMAVATILKGSYEEEEVFDLQTRQAVLCHLVKRMEATGGALSTSERDSIDAAFYGDMGLEVAVFEDAWRAIGTAKLSTIAQMGSTDDTADCDCPGGELLATVRFGECYASDIPPGDSVTFDQDLYGKRVKITWVHTIATAGNREFKLHMPLVVPGAGQQIKIVTEAISGDTPTKEWSGGPCPNDDPTAWTQGNVQGPGVGDWDGVATAEGGDLVMEYTYGTPEIPTEVYTSSVRFCPQDATGTTVWRLRIVEWENEPV